MKNEKTQSPIWVRLDNAAKIYPAAVRRNWSNIYRQSATLYEEVDKNILKNALEVVVKRFPSIAARLRSGAFWYYLEQVSSAPEIMDEYSYPLTYMSKKEMRNCAFRVIVYKKRIAIEFFHSLTDGTGALIFLKNLLAEYLEQKHGIAVPLSDGVIDRLEAPTAEELEDSFPKCAGPVPASRKDTDAWRMQGVESKNGFLTQTCFKIPVKDFLACAHQYDTTVTTFVNAAMMMSLLNLQNKKVPNVKRRKLIKIMMPVNLRNLFKSNTLRNFAMYITPDIDPRLGEYSFREILDIIKHKMALEITAKNMASIIATNVNDEINPLLRVVPLPIKNIVMKAVFDSIGEKKSCLSLSNIGVIKVPDIMNDYIERFDFVLGAQADAPYNCAMLSFKDTVYINFIRKTKDAELEREFYNVIKEFGLKPVLESNQF